MEREYRCIRTAADADAIRSSVEAVYDGWYAERDRIDWPDFLERLEDMAQCDLGNEWNSPAIQRIRAIVKALRNAA